MSRQLKGTDGREATEKFTRGPFGVSGNWMGSTPMNKKAAPDLDSFG